MLHITTLRGPLYSLHNQSQETGRGLYSFYKNDSYLFFPDFILQVEDSYDNIISYRPLEQSHQLPIDYIEPKSTWYTNIDIPYDHPSNITPTDNP